jgi:hypothetical protein
MVPVLSEHSTSMLAISSIATNLLTIASFLASAIAPIAIVTERTAGSAAGIEATVKINANWMISRMACPRKIETKKITITSPIARNIR